jgi:hypothetical protein
VLDGRFGHRTLTGRKRRSVREHALAHHLFARNDRFDAGGQITLLNAFG